LAAEDGEVAEAVVAEAAVDSEDLVVEGLAVEVRVAAGERQERRLGTRGLGARDYGLVSGNKAVGN